MNKKEISPIILRISISLVFLYFGFKQISNPDDWVGYIPEFLTSSIITANNLVVLNGIVEVSLGIFLLIGLYVKFSSLILAMHLLGITFLIGLTPTGVRDFGIAMATLSIFFQKRDKYSIDSKFVGNKKLKE